MYDNGGFQTGNFDAALDRLNGTREQAERDPFIGEGEHVLLVLNMQPFNHSTHGPSVRLSCEVVQSACHTVGTRVTKLWNITKPSKFPNQETDADRFTNFVRQLIGGTPGQPVGGTCRALIKDRVNDQLARGMLIHARGVNTSKKADKPWVEVYWKHFPQTQDEIKARRATVEAKLAAAPQPQAQPQQQYQQPQAAPGVMPGYATPQPQYQQMPPQYQQQPVMMPAQQQAPWPPQVQAPSPAPQPGGLLSQVPGTPTGGFGNGNQGNGGLIPF